MVFTVSVVRDSLSIASKRHHFWVWTQCLSQVLPQHQQASELGAAYLAGGWESTQVHIWASCG